MATKARILTCTTPKRNPTRAKTKAAKSNPTKPKAKKASKPKAKKNPSDLPTPSLKSRAKKAAKDAAESAKEKAKSAAKRAGAATSRAAKAGAKKGAEVAKKAARAGAAKGAEMTKKAAVYTGEKLKQGGKRVGRKAAGVAKEAWSGIVKGWKENPAKTQARTRWDGLKFEIDWLMGRVHVGTVDEEVRANIEKRCKKAGFDAKLTRRCSDYAIKAHRKNQQDYSDVMSGNRPKRRKTKKNPVGSWYQQTFSDEILYFKYTREQKKGLGGVMVRVRLGSRAKPKATNISVNNLGLWKTVREADVPVSVKEAAAGHETKKNPMLYKKIASKKNPIAKGRKRASETDDHRVWKTAFGDEDSLDERLLRGTLKEREKEARRQGVFETPETKARRDQEERRKPRKNPTPAATKHFKARLAAAKSELKACRDGTWPRDTNDAVRYQHLPRMPHDPPGEVRKAHQQYVAKLLKSEIDWLESKLARDNPSQDQVHLSQKGKQWHVLLDKHWVPIADAEAKRQIESGEAVKVPWSHKAMNHHDRPDHIDPKQLGLMLQNWHYGQGDPVYAAGSSLFAGKSVPTEILADALGRIRSLKTSSTSKHDKKGHKELVTIEKNLAYLVGSRKAREAGAKSNPVKKTVKYRGWTIEQYSGTQVGYQTYGRSMPEFGKGRKVSGWIAEHPEHMPNGKIVDTLKQAKEYIDEYMGPDENPVKKSVKFLAWTNAPAAYDYWYVKDTGKSVNGFRLVEVTDKERWEQFQVPRYESGNNVAFLASDKARVEQFGLKAKAKAKKNPVKSGGKVKARSITLTKLSGSKDVGKSVTLEGGNVWAKADRKLSLWAEPPAQEKVKFTVSYADAETYTGSYATKSSGRESLAGHIRMTLDAVASASPSQISETDRKKWQMFQSRYETGCKVCDNPTPYTILTVRRPNGNVETVRVEYLVLPGAFKKIQAATKAAGKGDVLSYEVVAERDMPSEADKIYNEHDAIVRAMVRGERKRNPTNPTAKQMADKITSALKSYKALEFNARVDDSFGSSGVYIAFASVPRGSTELDCLNAKYNVMISITDHGASVWKSGQPAPDRVKAAQFRGNTKFRAKTGSPDAVVDYVIKWFKVNEKTLRMSGNTKRNPTVTKLQVKKLLVQYKIPGQLTGKGQDWTLELPDEKAYKLWTRTAGKTVRVGGYRSGFGSWVLSPGYQSKGDPNDPSSRHHY